MGKKVLILGIAAVMSLGLTGCNPSVQSECDSVYSNVKDMDSQWNLMETMDDVHHVSDIYRSIALKLASMKFANADLQEAIDEFSKSTLAQATAMSSDSTTETQANDLRNDLDLAWAGLARVCEWTY